MGSCSAGSLAMGSCSAGSLATGSAVLVGGCGLGEPGGPDAGAVDVSLGGQTARLKMPQVREHLADRCLPLEGGEIRPAAATM